MAESSSNIDLTAPSSSNAHTQEAPRSEADSVLLAYIDRMASGADGSVAAEYTGTLRAHQVELFLLQQQQAAASENASSLETQVTAAAREGDQLPENSTGVPTAQTEMRERKRSNNRTLSSVVRAARVASAVSHFWGSRSAQLQRLSVLEPWNINRIALEEQLTPDTDATGGGLRGASGNGNGDGSETHASNHTA